MEKQLQPKLRFPEFDGDWEENRLEKLFSQFKSGNTITSKSIFENGKYPVFGGNGLRGYSDSYTHDGKYFLIGRQGALCGNINRFEGKAFISEHAIVCISNSKNDTDFLSQKLDFLNLNRLSESSAQPGLAVNKLLRLKLIVPQLPEQQKIADYLSTIDEKITLLEEKKTELSRYKKAMMQKLFSQEIRFKPSDAEPVEAYPDWEEKRLGDEIVVKVGATPSTLKKEFWNGDIPWINSSELKDGKISTPSKYITEIGFKNTSTYLLPKGTVVLAMTGATLGKLGILMLESTANQSVAGFVPNNNFLNEYLFYYLMHFQNKIFEKAGGAAQIGINKFNIESLKIDFPSLLEQQKIADFLSAIDESIDKVSEQIKETQSFKKAMLQQMFV